MTNAPAHRPLKVALLGCGVVGTQVARMLTEQADDLAARVGAPLELSGIAVRDVTTPRDAVIDPALLTTDAESLIDGADIVIEVMGGIEPARTLLLRAIGAGAAVITANKALLAADGPTLYKAADDAGVDIYFEAAVAGAIPIVRPVRESLAGDHVQRILGIVNGTTNYILDQMMTTGASLPEALAEAQAAGFAEADPTADVEGHDAAAKAAILASLAFHTRVRMSDVAVEGIMSLTSEDIAWAKRTGQVVKLLAVAERLPAGVSVRVHPALLPVSHPLAGVHGSFNAVFVEALNAGELMFYGRGAGGAPTASAVLGDIVSAARHRVLGGKGPQESSYAALPVLAPWEGVTTRLQIRMLVDDKLGVLARVAAILGENGISIDAVHQPAGDGPDERAELVIASYSAPASGLDTALAQIEELDVVRTVVSVIRVEGA